MPHSEISGSQPVSGSPKLIAAVHVLLRLSLSRHPPCALSSLTVSLRHASNEKRRLAVCSSDPTVCVLAIASAIAVRGKRSPRREHPRHPSPSRPSSSQPGWCGYARLIKFAPRTRASRTSRSSSLASVSRPRTSFGRYYFFLYSIVREQCLLSRPLLTRCVAFGELSGLPRCGSTAEPVEWS